MEQAGGDQPDRMNRLRYRVCSWLQRNSVYILTAFAGAEGFALSYAYEPPQDSAEQQAIEFRRWLGTVSAQDFEYRQEL